MKKAVLAGIFAVFLTVFAVFSPLNMSKTTAYIASENLIKSTIISTITDISEFKERIAGSQDEKDTCDYIKNFLDNNTNLLPLKNNFISDGIQKFRFQSIFDGNYYFSNNVIYYLPAKIETDKKLILCASYDSFAYKTDSYGNYSLTETEGVNQSAGSVALLLALAKFLPSNTYEFNIEFVFFGAGSSNNAGSEFYTQGISEDDAKNILLAINFDTISIGNNLYFYIDEFETDLAGFLNTLNREESIAVKEISIANLSKTLVNDNGMGLTYTHIAQTSNNLSFMRAGVLSMNIFAGDYDSGISVGRCEYSDKDVITYTSNDNLAYIYSNFDSNVITTNLLEVYNLVSTLISNKQFVSVCSASFGQTSIFYKIFGNQNLVIILTAILLLIFIIISLIIHYRLTVKSYNTNIEDDFVSVVLNMSSNVETKSSDDVTKNISEIVANDIKKDKKIKKK